MFRDFLAMLFPEFCIACQGPLVKGEDMICMQCRYELASNRLIISGRKMSFWISLVVKYC